jgi:hypothetical protein
MHMEQFPLGERIVRIVSVCIGLGAVEILRNLVFKVSYISKNSWVFCCVIPRREVVS